MEYSDTWVSEKRKPSKLWWRLEAKPPMRKNNLGRKCETLEMQEAQSTGKGNANTNALQPWHLDSICTAP